jgi:enoyl-CoA hydratase
MSPEPAPEAPRSHAQTGQPPKGDWLGTPYLRFERHGPLAHCVVDRLEKRNALTPAMYFGIRYAVNHTDATAELAGLLLTGTGDVFMPGGDLSGRHDDNWADLPGLLFMDNVPFDALRQSRKPVVAAINGICQGGGLMISMLCDVAVASDRATFRAPELFRGIADTYYAQILSRQIGPARARDMLMTGRTLSAAEAADWALVSRVVPHDELMEAATGALVECCRTGPDARVEIKRTLDQYYGLYDRIGMVKSLLGPESAEGAKSFFEKRPPDWINPDLPAPGGRI